MLPARPFRIALFLLLSVMLAACTTMATRGLADNLGQAILNQDDPETVKEGAPAYLLILDGFIKDSPDDPALLLAGARLYGAYAAVFVEDPERAKRMTNRARDYARRALCLRQERFCELEGKPFDEFAPALEDMSRADVPALYTYATAWAGWVQARREDWLAIADLPKIEAMLDRVVVLDEAYEQGQAHLYLGILRTRLPPSMGGKPEQGRQHFERAWELSDGRNLMAKVELARRYARLVFDRELHDRLLNEVLMADPREPNLTLSNTLAQQDARQLLASADDYF